MYSPKIDEALIPVLYHAARTRRMPMTKLVSLLIRKALATEDPPEQMRQEPPCRSPASPQAAA